MKIPKMSTRNMGNSVENHFGEERLPLRHKKVGATKASQLVFIVFKLLEHFCDLGLCEIVGV